MRDNPHDSRVTLQLDRQGVHGKFTAGPGLGPFRYETYRRDDASEEVAYSRGFMPQTRWV
jgi:hypothetical protein